MKEKSDLADIMIGLIKNLKNKYSLQVQYLCCDNAGEYVAFKKACKQGGLGIDCEYIAPAMPQKNGCIERKFSTLFNQVCAMCNSGKINAYLQNGFWAEATNAAMLLENNILTQVEP